MMLCDLKTTTGGTNECKVPLGLLLDLVRSHSFLVRDIFSVYLGMVQKQCCIITIDFRNTYRIFVPVWNEICSGRDGSSLGSATCGIWVVVFGVPIFNILLL